MIERLEDYDCDCDCNARINSDTTLASRRNMAAPSTEGRRLAARIARWQP